MKLRLFTAISAISYFGLLSAADFVWHNEKSPLLYTISDNTAPVVHTALEMFESDIEAVTGKRPVSLTPLNGNRPITGKVNPTLRIETIDRNDNSRMKKLASLGVPVDELAAAKDGFYIAVAGKGKSRHLLVVGADRRGTAYGILELSRMAGVSPWIWWADSKPEKKSSLKVDENFRTMQSPSVEYRGIFINDEDWSTMPWSYKTFEKGNPQGMIGARTYKEVFKFLMRMRANAIWPAMHECTVPFYKTPGAKEAADSCGIVIGTSHCEPLMKNNAGEWDVDSRGRFNYITNKESVTSYWTERLCEVNSYENIFTLGMRGVHDGAMEGVKTLEEKTVALQQVIDDQRVLLATHVNKDVESIPQQFVPYKEVLQIMENGLRVPEDITLTWCDDNYGYMTRLSDAAQQKRKGGAGVYYHLSYWGRPHDYLWLTTTQPGLIYNEMREAYDHNARRIWIANVHDLKPASYNVELFLDMAWNMDNMSRESLPDHHRQWLEREFGEKAASILDDAMTEFYRLCVVRKPEFMGWSKVEESKAIYQRGLTPVVDSEFSLTEFGGELDRHLQSFARIKAAVTEAGVYITEGKKDAFLSHIKYKVFAAEAMARKQLEAQRARRIASGIADSLQWRANLQLMTACARSESAYAEIMELTEYYNKELAGGKWENSMNMNPRDLPVFRAPTLPLKLSQDEIKTFSAVRRQAQVRCISEVKPDRYIVRNASDYDASTTELSKTWNLGHSMSAVSLPKGESATFEFESEWEGEAVLRCAVIPTQPNDKGDIRFSVSIDGEEPVVSSYKESGRTETWKHNVLRGQAVKNTLHKISKGKHTLTITALDNHVIIDQWMLDFVKERKFYVMPVKAAY